MKKLMVVSVVVVTMMAAPIGAVGDTSSGPRLGPSSTHDFWLSPLTSQIYSFQCQEGDTITGSFTITTDGDHFIYDQKKYDLWPGWGDGVDFYILDETNFSLLNNDQSFTPFYTMTNIVSLKWSVSVPHSGDWYVIYDNDSSVYGKQIIGSIDHLSVSQSILYALTLIGLGALLLTVVGFVRWMHRAK
jgi:hypothetical protein